MNQTVEKERLRRRKQNQRRARTKRFFMVLGVLVVALAGMMFVTRNIDWYAVSLPKMKANKEVTTDDELRIWK